MTALLGVLIGLVMALTGAGGGMLSVPLLIFACRLPLSQAAPIALLAVFLAALLGAILGLRTRHVRYRAAALMAVAGFLGAPLGIWIGRQIPNAPLTLVFAAVLAASALRMAFLEERPGAVQGDGNAPCAFDASVGKLRWTARCARALAAAGFCAGVFSSMLGVGGGFVLVPVLMHVTDLDLPGVTATSLAVIALVSAASFAATWISGQEIPWALALPFAVGAMAGLMIGRRIALRTKPRLLHSAFAALSLVVAAIMLLHVTFA